MIRQKLQFMGLFCFLSMTSLAQTFSLKEAVDYAILHHVQVKNSQLDLQNAGAKINEIKAIGLPQVNAGVTYTNNLIIQRMFIPAKTFNPSAAEGEIVAAEFGVKNSGMANVGLSQLVFDGTYLLGLKASEVYKELSTKNLVQSKQQVAEALVRAMH